MGTLFLILSTKIKQPPQIAALERNYSIKIVVEKINAYWIFIKTFNIKFIEQDVRITCPKSYQLFNLIYKIYININNMEIYQQN